MAGIKKAIKNSKKPKKKPSKATLQKGKKAWMKKNKVKKTSPIKRNGGGVKSERAARSRSRRAKAGARQKAGKAQSSTRKTKHPTYTSASYTSTNMQTGKQTKSGGHKVRSTPKGVKRAGGKK